MSHRAALSLPTEFAVFPLEGALLLPHGQLPLNIFEPRYLRMVDDVLGGPRVIGMIQPDPAQPEGAEGPALYMVGCLGRLTSFSETGDGRYLIALTGTSRFRIVRELAPRHGYRRVQADFAPFGADQEPGTAGLQRDRLMAALHQFFTARGLDANWKAIEAMPDPALVNSLSMSCPFSPPERQALLEADLPERARTLLALLQMGAHDPAPGHRPS